MPKSKHDVVTSAFIITAIIITASIAGPTLNYSEFYESIGEVDLLVSGISFIQESNNPIIIAITTVFTVVYPARYSGLKLRSVQIIGATGHLAGQNLTIKVSGEQYFYNDIALTPMSNMTVQTIHREEETTAALALAQVKNVQAQLVWDFQCRLLLDAFLETPVDLNFNPSYSQKNVFIPTLTQSYFQKTSGAKTI